MIGDVDDLDLRQALTVAHDLELGAQLETPPAAAVEVDRGR
jgi:hypothetical protein